MFYCSSFGLQFRGAFCPFVYLFKLFAPFPEIAIFQSSTLFLKRAVVLASWDRISSRSFSTASPVPCLFHSEHFFFFDTAFRSSDLTFLFLAYFGPCRACLRHGSFFTLSHSLHWVSFSPELRVQGVCVARLAVHPQAAFCLPFPIFFSNYEAPPVKEAFPLIFPSRDFRLNRCLDADAFLFSSPGCFFVSSYCDSPLAPLSDRFLSQQWGVPLFAQGVVF